MRHATQAGIGCIKGWEVFVPTIYVCAAGYRTIYWGHVVRPGEIFDGTEEDGEKYLRQDLVGAELAVLRNINVPLSACQFDALVSFTFNVGGGALQRSTLRQVLNREDYDEVPAQMVRWVYGGGRILKGLVRRRQAEAQMFMGGLICPSK